MGMDGVELLMDLEDRFGVSFDDEESIYLFMTPARIEWLVREKLAGHNPAIVDFEKQVQWITDRLNSIPGGRTFWLQEWSLETAFPPKRRYRLWGELSDALGVKLPALELADSACPRIPRYVSTIERLAFWMLDHHFDSFPIKRPGTPLVPLGTGQWLKDDEVSTGIVESICHCLGVEPLEVTPDTLLRDELGMD